MKIRTKIYVSFLTIFVLVASLIGLVTGMYTTNIVRNKIYTYLHLGNQTKAEHIRTFLRDQKNSTKILAGTLSVEQYLMRKNTDTEYLSDRDLLAECFGKIIENNPNIYEIFVLNTDGKIVVTTDKMQLGLDKSSDAYFIGGKNDTYIKNLYYSESIGKINYTISSPVRDDKTGNLLGVIVVRYDPKNFYTIVKNENGLGKTEENFLVNKDNFFITPSLFLGESVILKQKAETQNVNECFDPKEIEYVTNHGYGGLAETVNNEIVEAKDYRNVDIIASHAYIPETGWCLVTKIDKKEAFGFRTNLILIYLSIFISGGFVYVLTAFFISKKITDPLKALAEGAQKVEQGDFDYKTNIKTEDEIGALSRSFNKMTAAVKTSRIEIETKVSQQTKEITEKSLDLENQQKAILNILEDVEEEKNKTQDLATDLQKFKLAVDSTAEHIVITDSEGIILYANQAVKSITGFDSKEVLGKKAGNKDLWGGIMDKKIYEDFWTQIKKDKKPFLGEFNNKRKDGSKYIAQANVSPVLDKDGNVAFFVGIERDITKIKDIDRMKTEFISLASHQLRTPLSAMKWFSEMLLAGDAGKLTGEQTEYVNNIYQSNERMVDLVNSLLNISRIESGRIIINPSPTDLGQLVNDALTELQNKIKEKEQNLIVSVHPNLPKIDIDPKLIREVYNNLLTNAIKYTPQKGEISIFISKNETDILSQITDTGYGIPKKDYDKLFQKFYRGENIVKLETEGTGLGLYLAKAIIESSGGKIWFESEEGKGTSFWFSLPLTGSVPKKGDVSIDS